MRTYERFGGLRVISYCIMSNHFHILLEVPQRPETMALPNDADTRLRKQVRFIFSHSALREGWDNPNVFVIYRLKHSDSTISRRQKVGRGMRLCVNQ